MHTATTQCKQASKSAMQKQNTICVGRTTINVTNKQRPFSNNFMQLRAVMHTDDIVHAEVRCTQDSIEPGRVYAVFYALNGELLACNTLN